MKEKETPKLNQNRLLRGTKFIGSLFLKGEVFCMLRELIFAIVEDSIFFLGANFCDLREVAFN